MNKTASKTFQIVLKNINKTWKFRTFQGTTILISPYRLTNHLLLHIQVMPHTDSPLYWSPRIGNMRTRLRMKDKFGSCVTTCLTSGARDCSGVAGHGTLLIPLPRICWTRGDGVGGLLAALPPDPLSPPSLKNSCSKPVERDAVLSAIKPDRNNHEIDEILMKFTSTN